MKPRTRRLLSACAGCEQTAPAEAREAGRSAGVCAPWTAEKFKRLAEDADGQSARVPSSGRGRSACLQPADCASRATRRGWGRSVLGLCQEAQR
jgi:hypothetical protein